ncbi:hypothetical protein IAI10_06935 [Clostridium sp. 19966]|nr:hypothetical protein [Clostridium sp. 19966]MDT8716388.1 hypothetical protein [Clostridium sp. 19966]
MYDAKKDEKEKKDDMKYKTIIDRAYYDKTKIDNVITSKPSYVPQETLFY